MILTGAGDKAFCTGIDREEAIAESYLDDDEARDRMRSQTGSVSTPFQYNDPGVNINPKQNDLWKPVIAAEHATFFDPHITYGMVAGFESMHLLQKLPLGETLRVALLGAHERMSAARAYQLGLVSEVVPAADLRQHAMWVARAIASAPACAVQGTLRAVWMAHESARREALAQMSSLVMLERSTRTSPAARRRTRQPEWSGGRVSCCRRSPSRCRGCRSRSRAARRPW